MNLLMLRGEVPRDRNPQEIVFDRIEDCDDMWTQLFYTMSEGHNAELWYWNGKREHKFRDNFTERWVPSYEDYQTDFKPDVIFCRGGFKQYACIVKRYPKALSIYYGAGRRYLPQDGAHYDVILQDSPEQLAQSQKKFPMSYSTLFVKPAADNLFYPMHKKVEFEVCFPANGRQPFKGHDFVYGTCPSHLKILNLGNKSKVRVPDNVTSFRVLRPNMAENINRCRVGIVACRAQFDSCPRVIPEMLACGLPVVVLDETRFWKDRYITEETGRIASRPEFWDVVQEVLETHFGFSSRAYYEANLSLQKAAEYLLGVIRSQQNPVS